MQRTTKRHPTTSSVWARLIAALVLCLPLLVGASPVAAAPEDLCAAQVAAAEALDAEIAAHNARPHLFELPRQQAAFNAYDAEAAALDARKAQVESQLRACLDAMKGLADDRTGAPELNPVPDRTRTALEEAIKQIPATWQPPPAPPVGRNWRVPKTSPIRPVYDLLRADNPPSYGDVRLQGQSRPTAGTADPAYPAASGRVYGTFTRGQSAASPDHIIPLAEIVNMPGFTKLTPMNMWAVTRAPANLQWMSEGANLSKQSRSVAGMAGVDPAWQAAQLQVEAQIRQKLLDLINKLLQSQA